MSPAEGFEHIVWIQFVHAVNSWAMNCQAASQGRMVSMTSLVYSKPSEYASCRNMPGAGHEVREDRSCAGQPQQTQDTMCRMEKGLGASKILRGVACLHICGILEDC